MGLKSREKAVSAYSVQLMLDWDEGGHGLKVRVCAKNSKCFTARVEEY